MLVNVLLDVLNHTERELFPKNKQAVFRKLKYYEPE